MSSRSRLNGTVAATRRPAFTADMFEPPRGQRADSNADDESDARPSSAPGNRNGLVRSLHSSGPGSIASVQSSPRSRQKPQLSRSKSEHVLRADHDHDQDLDPDDEEIYNWGARHGFEDHYQSEDIISQLASVSSIPRGSTRFLAYRSFPAAGMVYVLHRQATRNDCSPEIALLPAAGLENAG